MPEKAQVYMLPKETEDYLLDIFCKNPLMNTAIKACKKHNENAAASNNDQEHTFLICGSTLFKAIINDRGNLDKVYGISDIDIIYFDHDTSYEAEDRIIKSVLSNIDSDIQNMFDIKNQAKVHIWKSEKYGIKVKPYQSAEEPLHLASTHLQMAALKIVNQSTFIEIYSPFWYYDIMHYYIRYNDKSEHGIEKFYEKSNDWKNKYSRFNIILP